MRHIIRHEMGHLGPKSASLIDRFPEAFKTATAKIVITPLNPDHGGYCVVNCEDTAADAFARKAGALGPGIKTEDHIRGLLRSQSVECLGTDELSRDDLILWESTDAPVSYRDAATYALAAKLYTDNLGEANADRVADLIVELCERNGYVQLAEVVNAEAMKHYIKVARNRVADLFDEVCGDPKETPEQRRERLRKEVKASIDRRTRAAEEAKRAERRAARLEEAKVESLAYENNLRNSYG